MINYLKNYSFNILSIVPYALEYRLLNAYSSFKGHPLRDASKHKRLKNKMISYIKEGMKDDAKLCNDLGITPHLPSLRDIKLHLNSLIDVFKDYDNVLKNRKSNNLKTGSKRDYPDYFNRNFHFQSNGYTSTDSAKLYDHQVDILFAGMALPMRRAILEVFKDYKPKNILELACGTGSATQIVANFLPKSKITSTDLSYEYIDYAKQNCVKPNVTFKQMDATKIEGKYDCIFHVFLIHELPSKQREEVLKQQITALNDDGLGIIVESLQVGDVEFMDEVLYDFPVYYHEPFFKHYIENSVEAKLKELGAQNIKVTKRLFSKVISFTK